jgi:hypothetical protein
MRAKVSFAVLVSLLMVLAGGSNAWAVWGGAVDTTHPGVGALYFDDSENNDGSGVRLETGGCSGSYAGRSLDQAYDVFLTAGHCVPPEQAGIPASRLYVSFDGDATDGVTGAIQAVAFVQMPGFGHDRGDPRDLSVVLLPAGSVGSLPAVQLPAAGYLDALKAAGTLKFLTVDIVGYGVTPNWGPGGPTFFTDGGVRRSGSSVAIGLTQAFLKLMQNPRSLGTGSGACFGDSGSPQLEHGTLRILSLTNGGNGQCNSTNYNYRLDTPIARAFLGGFLALP